MVRRIFLVVSALGFLGLVSATPRSTMAEPNVINWLQFGLDSQHDSNNTHETTINLDNVSQLHPLFQMTLQGAALPVEDGAPVYLSNVQTPGGVQDLLFVSTMAADVIAVNAHTGIQVWVQHESAPNGCVSTFQVECYLTSSPAIDPNLKYVYSRGMDGYIHKLNVGDGSEVIGNGWPELSTWKQSDEKGSSALSLASDLDGNNYLYATSSGYPGDKGDYQGHLTTINLETGAQHVFNVMCSNQVDVHFKLNASPDCDTRQGGVWGRSGVVYSVDTDRIYFSTGSGEYMYAINGNGGFDPSHFNWGESVLALNPDGSGDGHGYPLDSYTPSDHSRLDKDDLDLAGAPPAILPTRNGLHYAVQGGKDSRLRIINLDNLSGQGGPGHEGGELASSLIDLPQTGMLRSQIAVWTNPQDNKVWVFTGNENGLSGLQLKDDLSGWTGVQWMVTDNPCFSPVIANGVLFCAGGTEVRAINPVTGEIRWRSGPIGSIHWQSPIVVNGVLYITDNNKQINAFWLG